MFQLRISPTWPRKTVVLTIQLTTNSLQRCPVEDMLVCHMSFETLRGLTCIANRPYTLIKFTGYIFNQWLVILNFNLTEHPISKTELLGHFVYDGVIR